MGFLGRLVGRSQATPTPRGSGIFAGLFVAPREAVERWDMSSLTPDDWRVVEFKRLSPVELGVLESILTGRAYESIDLDSLLAPLRDGGENGPWVIPVRAELAAALAELAPDRRRR